MSLWHAQGFGSCCQLTLRVRGAAVVSSLVRTSAFSIQHGVSCRLRACGHACVARIGCRGDARQRCRGTCCASIGQDVRPALRDSVARSVAGTGVKRDLGPEWCRVRRAHVDLVGLQCSAGAGESAGSRWCARGIPGSPSRPSADRRCSGDRSVCFAQGLRFESHGFEQVQLCACGAAERLQRVECGCARSGRLGVVHVRLLAHGPRVILCVAKFACCVHIPIYCVFQSLRRINRGLGGSEGFYQKLHGPWRSCSFTLS